MKAFFSDLLRYVFNVMLLPLILLDIALNVVLFMGSPLETISRHAGRVKLAYGAIPRYRFMLRFVEWITELFDDNHIIEAVRARIGSLGVLDRPEDIGV